MDTGGSDSSNRLSAAALAALQSGNKIAAIKITREDYSLGLKEAKDRVEAYVADNPALKEQIRLHSGGSGTLGWLVMMVLAIAAIIYFWLMQ